MARRYLQLYESLREAINQGFYRGGERLPASRVLAKEQGVSRNTVVRAYDMLVSEGYITSRVGDGMRVSHDLPDKPWLGNANQDCAASEPVWSPWGQRLSHVNLSQPVAVDHFLSRASEVEDNIVANFQYGYVAMGEHLNHQWRRLAAKWSRLYSQDYGDPQGLLKLRQVLAAHSQTYRGCSSDADNIVIASSAQQLFTMVVALIAQPGDTVVIEEPWYHRFRDVLILADVNIIAVPVDGDGLRMDILAQRTIEQGIIPKLIYVTPSHQFPSGVVMSLSRRLALLEWCYQHNVWILEDDYDSEYRYQGQPIDALQSLDKHGHVIYVGTASKIICPSLRIAYGLFPTPWVKPMITALKQTHRHSAWMEQYMLAELIESGEFVRHIRRQRRQYESNRIVLVSSLERYFGQNIIIEGDSAGLHVIVWFSQWRWTQQAEILEALVDHGVVVYPIDHLYQTPRESLGLMMGYATLNHQAIVEGVSMMQQVLYDLIER